MGNYQKAIDCIQIYVFSMFELVTNVLQYPIRLR